MPDSINENFLTLPSLNITEHSDHETISIELKLAPQFLRSALLFEARQLDSIMNAQHFGLTQTKPDKMVPNGIRYSNYSIHTARNKALDPAKPWREAALVCNYRNTTQLCGNHKIHVATTRIIEVHGIRVHLPEYTKPVPRTNECHTQEIQCGLHCTAQWMP